MLIPLTVYVYDFILHFMASGRRGNNGSPSPRTKAMVSPPTMPNLVAFRAPVRPRIVWIIGFNGVSILDLAGPLDTLAASRMAGPHGQEFACYEVRVISLTGRTFTSDSHCTLRGGDRTAASDRPDTAIIPGSAQIPSAGTIAMLAGWLKRNCNGIRRIAVIGSGIYPVAETGLLDQRRVTTHWRFVQDLSRRFPKLRVDNASSFIKDGRFYTAGGGMSAIEMSLAMIEEDYGATAALPLARNLLLRLRPPGDTKIAIDASQFQRGPTERFADLPAWISAHLDENLSIEALAERVCVSPRHFHRLFKRFFKMRPAEFVENLRIDEARRRLLSPRDNIEAVASAVGFQSSTSFRRAFRRRYRISPTVHRRHSQRCASTILHPQVAA